MSDVSLHPAVLRGILRMKYGTMGRFSEQAGLGRYALRDLLRGKSSTAKPAVAEALGITPEQLTISENSTNVEIVTKNRKRKHRQNAGAQ